MLTTLGVADSSSDHDPTRNSLQSSEVGYGDKWIYREEKYNDFFRCSNLEVYSNVLYLIINPISLLILVLKRSDLRKRTEEIFYVIIY